MARLFTRCAKDRRGASLVEFTIVLFPLLLITGGIVEYGWLFYQWNAASKAVQQGLRLASVSDPVSSDLSTLSKVDVPNGILPGDPVPAFTRRCRGDTQSCSDGGTYNPTAMETIVYGRGQSTCGSIGPDGVAAMCDVYWPIRPENVVITYEQTGLGFAGRPGGPVPTITIELTGLTYNYIFLGGFLNKTSLGLPSLKSTITGEDLATAGT
jgi:hypothetical protein